MAPSPRGPTRREWLSTLGLAGVGGLAGFAGCLGDDEGESPPAHYRANEYVEAVASDARTLLHHQADDERSLSAVELALDGAYAVTTEHEVFPLWLDLERLDEEGQVYEARLREDLYWSDPYGQMTAEDWVYHVRNVHQGEDNWAASGSAGAWSGIAVERTGRLTFEIELPEPNVEFPFEPTLWGARCYPKDLLRPYVEERDREGLVRDEELARLSYAGNLGPYTFERWNRDGEFVAVANEDYYVRGLDDVPEEWTDAPHFDRYVYRVIGEEASRLEALRAREVTAASVPPERAREFREEEHVQVDQVPQPFLKILAYNQRRNGWEPFRRRSVRQAVSTAVDKVEIVENVLRGAATVAHTFQPRWSDWYVDDEVRRFGEGETHSHERARELLADALGPEFGYADDGRFVDPDGEQVRLTLAYVNTTARTQTTAEIVARELDAIGIDVDLKGASFDRLQNQYVLNGVVGDGEPDWSAGPANAGPRDRTESERDWDLLYGITFNTFPRTPASTERFWTERGSANFYGYVPEADLAGRFAAARRTTDPDARREILGEIFGVLSEEQPVDFVATSDDVTGYQDYLEGPREEFGHDWNALQTWHFGEV